RPLFEIALTDKSVSNIELLLQVFLAFECVAGDKFKVLFFSVLFAENEHAALIGLSVFYQFGKNEPCEGAVVVVTAQYVGKLCESCCRPISFCVFFVNALKLLSHLKK